MAEALAAGVALDTVYAESAAGLDVLVDGLHDAGVRVRAVDDGVLDKVLDLGSAQGVVATAAIADDAVAAEDILRRAATEGRPVIGLVELADPGNVGTIIRQAEAFGAAGVLSIGNGVDIYNPKTVRAAAGALFRVPVANAVDDAGVLAAALEAGVVSAATAGDTAGRGGVPPLDAPLGAAVLVLIGNEAHGLRTASIEGADLVLSIPMEGHVESLNAATAAAVVLYEAARQRSELGSV